jgi:hypothetical protein
VENIRYRGDKMTKKSLEREEIEILKKTIAQFHGIKLILDYSTDTDLLYWGKQLMKASYDLSEKNRLYNLIITNLIEDEADLSKEGIVFEIGFRKIKK